MLVESSRSKPEEMREVVKLWKKNAPATGKGQCKGPEDGVCGAARPV